MKNRLYPNMDDEFEYKKSDKCKQCHRDTPMRYVFCRPGIQPCKADKRDDAK